MPVEPGSAAQVDLTVSDDDTSIKFGSGDVPVLVRGGGKAPEEEILRRTAALMRQGAKGIVYGRNVVQHENPKGMTQALMAVVHDGASADDASAHGGRP